MHMAICKNKLAKHDEICIVRPGLCTPLLGPYICCVWPYYFLSNIYFPPLVLPCVGVIFIRPYAICCLNISHCALISVAPGTSNRNNKDHTIDMAVSFYSRTPGMIKNWLKKAGTQHSIKGLRAYKHQHTRDFRILYRFPYNKLLT